MPTINDRYVKTVNKLNINGDLFNIIDEGCRSQIDNLYNRIEEIEEVLEILKAEIKEINKKLNKV